MGGGGDYNRTGPDATPPHLSIKTCGGGEQFGGGGGGGRLEGGGGGAGGCGGWLVGWLVGWLYDTAMAAGAPPPPPGSPPDGPMPRQWVWVALSTVVVPQLLLPAHSLLTLFPLSSRSPCRLPLVSAPAVPVPRTVSSTVPVSACHTLSPSPDMNLVSPASAGSAISWTSSDPVLSFVPSQVLHEPAHHLRPTLELQHRDHVWGHILSPRDSGPVVSSSPLFSQARPTTR